MITEENEKALQTIPEVPLCKYVLVPLLKAMGYKNVVFQGGAEEYGVDIYFCKEEPTGKSIEYAAIVERHDIHKRIGKKGVVHDLLQHIKEAVLNPVQVSTPERKELRNIQMVWIVTTGKITEPAKNHIRNEIAKQLQFRNLQFFNGGDVLSWVEKFLPNLLKTSYFMTPKGFPESFWNANKYEILERLELGDPKAKHELLGKDFVGEKLQNKVFEGATMMGSSFVRSDLTKSNFMDAALMGADFSGVCLFEANMTHASCMGAYFNGTDMRKVKLRDAAFMGAYLRSAICTDADLQGTAFMGAKLEGADFRRSNLKNAFFNETMLNSADLRQAKVRNTDFTKADLEGADLRKIEFDDDTLKSISRAYNWTKATFDPNVKKEIELLSATSKSFVNSSESSKTLKLQLKCKTCGVSFDSGIAMSRRSLETCVLRGNVHQCPSGHKHAYNKEDYFFQQ